MRGDRPLIGLSGRRKRVDQVDGFPANLSGRDVDLYLVDYSRAVAAAGGLPVHIPVDIDPGAYLAHLDGLVLTGGADVDPARYGRPNIAAESEPLRDEGEWALLAAALDREVPVLGICRGLQLLNVYTGGTLHQDVPAHARYDLDPGTRIHPVTFDADTRLGALYGPSLHVNSLHHQTVDTLGRGLRVAGWADDGTVEAVELEGLPVLAVQWHPEMLDDLEPVWTWLIDQAHR